jgi:hypothetical protein
MRLITVQFDYPREFHKPRYSTLLNRFRESVAEHMPGVRFEEHRIEAPGRVEGKEVAFVSNTVKLAHWVNEVRQAREPLILADCDMLAIGDASVAFEHDFDVAYTVRTQPSRCPMNGGIMFVRPTAAAVRFFEAMHGVNRLMFNNPEFHEPWKKKYVGYNQAAFGFLLETGQLHGAKVVALPCRKYNAVDNDWAHIDGDTRFIHIKGALRQAVLSKQIPSGKMAKAMNAWYAKPAAAVR